MAKTNWFIKLGSEIPESAMKVESLSPEIIMRAKMAGESAIVGEKIGFRDFLWIKKQNLNFPIAIAEKFG